MSNSSNVSGSFVLLGLVDMEGYEYLYCAVCLVAYIFIMLLSVTIVYTVLTEPTLHEPMYILICNLVFNGIFGSSSFFPKLIVDLISSSKTISRDGCLTQAFCILAFTSSEISAFALMAFDRYLAVCNPLQYTLLMTNEKVFLLIAGSSVFVITVVLIAVLLSARLPVCGSLIRNIFCDNMSFFILSCVDSSLNNLYGTVVSTVFLMVTISITLYSYLRIFLISFRISKEARQKTLHTLVTHLLNFSLFFLGATFLFIRYRLANVNLPLVAHVLLSVTCLVFPPILNPLIFGVRTKALYRKINHRFHKMKKWLEL